MKKTISALLALCLLLGLCVGCGNTDNPPAQTDEPSQSSQANQPGQTDGSGNVYKDLLGIDPSETALESDGNQIPMELYLYWLTYSCGNLEYQLNMYKSYYGMYTELVNEDGSILWDGDLEGQPAGELARQQAEDNALSYAIIENVAAKHNISLTDEDNAKLAEDKTAYIQQLGGQEAYERNLREMGISEACFDRVAASGSLYQHLLELAQDPSSDLYQAPTDDDAYVDHILLMTKDSETNEPLSEEDIQAKRELAEDLLAQLQASDDVETLFTQLAEEYCEDPGRAAGTGYLINPDTNFVQEFLDAAFALKPGELSGIVESDYGYHILLRKELTETHLTTVADQNLASYMDSQLVAARDTLVRSDKLDGINVGEFFAKYKEAVEVMYSQEDAAGSGDTQPAE